MVLESRQNTEYNAMLGRRIPHPASTKFDGEDDIENSRPSKRLKTYESTDDQDSRDVSEDESQSRNLKAIKKEIPDSDADDDSEKEEEEPHLTELESALAPVKTDKDAIREYEAMRADGELSNDLKDRLHQRTWTKGKSSIYVDAFNLALETVLEDEGHLFDEKEMEVFNQWRALDYEAQYL